MNPKDQSKAGETAAITDGTPENITPSRGDQGGVTDADLSECHSQSLWFTAEGTHQTPPRLRDPIDVHRLRTCVSLGVCPLRNPFDVLCKQAPGPRLFDPD